MPSEFPGRTLLLKGALERLDRALQTARRHAKARFHRAMALDQLGRRVEAAEILRRLAVDDDRQYSQKARNYLEEIAENAGNGN